MGIYYHFQNDRTKEIVQPHSKHNIKWYSPVGISQENFVMMAHLLGGDSMYINRPNTGWFISSDAVECLFDLEEAGYKDVTEEKYNEIVEKFGLDRLPPEFNTYIEKK